MASTTRRPGTPRGARKPKRRGATQASGSAARGPGTPRTKGKPAARGSSTRRAARARSTDPDGLGAHVAARFRAIYAVVRRIPRGRVATYGQVAELAGLPGGARVVGRAMRASVPEQGLPWQRVVGKRGPGMAKISIHDPIGAAAQRALLEDEGVAFTPGEGISLREYGWLPAGRAGRRAR